MSNELATISPETMEALVVGGDLKRLSPVQRLEVYSARCAAAGIDPRTQPFQYLELKGKLTLYATKAATDQIISARRLTVEVVDRVVHADLGLAEARVRVSFPDGRHVEDVAAVSINGLKGEDLANALMKVVTKAKRRTVLSACGLGMLDELETETIPGAARVDVAAMHEANPQPLERKAIDLVAGASKAQLHRIGEIWGDMFGDMKLTANQNKARDHMKRHIGVDTRHALNSKTAAQYLDILEVENAQVEAEVDMFIDEAMTPPMFGVGEE
jgi:hypothetical protein